MSWKYGSVRMEVYSYVDIATWTNGYASNVFCIWLYFHIPVVAMMDNSIPIKVAMYIALL